MLQSNGSEGRKKGKKGSKRKGERKRLEGWKEEMYKELKTWQKVGRDEEIKKA